MTLQTIRRFKSAVLMLAFIALGASPTVPPEHQDKVTTIAGSSAGYQDGAARNAEFSVPSSLAYTPHNDLVILDSGASVVRELTHGVVRTIAGVPSASPWGHGGYRNGPALKAQFNHPRGIAAAPNGTLYVADTLNGCIRRIYNGAVTTVAGRPGAWGSDDGPALAARLKLPVALTVDDKGDVFVADYGNGVRELKSDGTVTTLPEIHDTKVVGISFGKGHDSSALFVAAVDVGLIRLDLQSRKAEMFPSSSNGVLQLGAQGGVEIGVPQALSALDNHVVAYTDVRTETVRLMNYNYARVLAGKPAWDFDRFSGGYADGDGDNAQFNSPLGIAFAHDGSLAVADGGNHRIRRITGFDTRLYAMPDGTYMDDYAPHEGDAAIAWVGNSLSWTDNTWGQSIAAHVQDDLRRDQIKADVIPFTAPGASLSAISSAVETYFSAGAVQCVVLQMNSAFVTDYGRKSYKSVLSDSSSFTQITSDLSRLRRDLEKEHVRLIVVAGPYGYEVSPTETMQLQELVPYWADIIHSDVVATYTRLLQAVKSAGVPVYDAWPSFESAESIGGAPLFGTIDPHMTEAGRQLMAKAGAIAIRKYDPALRPR